MMSNCCNEDSCGTLEYTRIENEMIIGFNLWGEKRICLPQLLRFVLNDFDIDIIDRAVTDLQINCFQCSAEQMRMLNETNIFPTQIIRCGLIRKSDAERLCKYILQPNQMFDNLSQFNEESLKFSSIQVVHMCFGQQDGILYPVLYTTVDAKCIRCTTCENVFRTYEFVGHTHKLDEVSSTSHWGFDSSNWRLLIHLNIPKSDVSTLQRSRSIIDRVKLLFYEEELNKMGKFSKTVIWRPRKKIKLPQPPKMSNPSSMLPSHLNQLPADVYQKSGRKPVTAVVGGHNWARLVSTAHPPNIYLRAPPCATSDDEEDGNTLTAALRASSPATRNRQRALAANDSSIEDDDPDDEEQPLVEANQHRLAAPATAPLLQTAKPQQFSSSEAALNAALQIKKEIMPKDLLTLGAVSLFLSQRSSAVEQQTQQQQQVMVAQSTSSVPQQYLMLEAVWAQLLRDIMQAAPGGGDQAGRSRLVSQLLRCQEIFRTQWTGLAEDNCQLKESLLAEQKQRRDLEQIRDKLVEALNDLQRDKDGLLGVIEDLERERDQLRRQQQSSPPLPPLSMMPTLVNQMNSRKRRNQWSNGEREELGRSSVKKSSLVDCAGSPSSTSSTDSIVSDDDSGSGSKRLQIVL